MKKVNWILMIIMLVNLILPAGTSLVSVAAEYEGMKKTTLVNLNFDDEKYTEGALSTTGTYDGFVVSKVTDGDTLSIAKDPQTNSKALYIERAEENLTSTSNTGVNIPLGKSVKSGVVEASFSIRSENYRSGFGAIGTLANQLGQRLDSCFTYDSYFLSALRWSGAYQISALDKTKYLTVKKIIDFDNGLYSVYYYVDGTLKQSKEKQAFSIDSDIDCMMFKAFKEGSDDPIHYGNTGNGKYYIDNIVIDHYDFPKPELVKTTLVDLDFDDAKYTEGALSATGTYDSFVVSNIIQGDTLSIAVDPQTNSKALYLERAEDNLTSRTSTGAYVPFGKSVKGGVVEASFSIRNENYRSGLGAIGTLGNYLGQRLDVCSTFGDYYLSGLRWNAAYMISSVDKTKYLTVKKIIDIDNGLYSVYYYVDGELKQKKEEQEFSTTDANIDRMMFGAFNENSDDPIYYGNTGNAKYYIDNILIEHSEWQEPEIIKTTLADLNFDSEKYTTGTLSATETYDGFVVSKITDGDTLSIATDPQTNSKALYLERDENNLTSTSGTGINVPFSRSVNSGILEATMSLRSENYRSGFGAIGTLANQAGQRLDVCSTYGEYYLSGLRWSGAYQISALDKTKYLTVKKIIDFDNGLYSVYYYVDGELKQSKENQTYATDSINVDRMTISAFKEGSGDPTYSGNTGNGKYYIDNILVQTYANPNEVPKVIWTTPVNLSENAGVNDDVIISTTTKLDPSSVTKTNVVVKKGTAAIDEKDYEVSVVNDKNIKISFNTPLLKETTYTVEIKDIKAKVNNGTGMNKLYSFSFTTAGNYKLDIVNVTPNLFNSNEIDITYNLENVACEKGIDLIFASYSGDKLNGMVRDAVVDAGKIKFNTVSVPAGDRIVCYPWESINTLKPVDIPVPVAFSSTRTYGADKILNTNEPITIGFIGGSITQQNQWIPTVEAYFAEKYPGRQITYKKAGVGGTGSGLQQFRVYEDIIQYQPDLVFMDATINDSQGGVVDNPTYENVIRKLLDVSHQPSIIAVCFGEKASSEDDTWEKTFNGQKLVNDAYNIPMIDVYTPVQKMIDNGETTWEIITSDSVHPNSTGGALYGGIVVDAIKGMANPIRKMTPASTPIYSNYAQYKNARLISWREASYEGTWKEGTRNSGQFHDGTVETATVGNKVTVSFYGKAIGLYGLRGKSHAVLKCYVDGVPQSNKISTYLGSQSLMSANTSYVLADEVGYHTVTFETESFSDEEAFLAFGYFVVY